MEETTVAWTSKRQETGACAHDWTRNDCGADTCEGCASNLNELIGDKNHGRDKM